MQRFFFIVLLLLGYGAFCQDTVSYMGTISKGKTISFQQKYHSVQLYKKHKRSGIPERAMYFDKDYYRFQYAGKGTTKLLRVNDVIATRKNDSVFVDDRVYRVSYDEKYHAYDFKRDTVNVLTVQHWVGDSADYDDAYDIDVTVFDSLQDIAVLRLFAFETVSRHIKASGISRPVAIVICSVLTGGTIALIKSKSEEDDTL
jgi:hypothetical protein